MKILKTLLVNIRGCEMSL